MKRFNCLIVLCSIFTTTWSQSGALVFQSDFGLKDGAVAAMKGVAFSVSPDLKMFDLTHEIPAYNIWEAAYRLNQTAAFWPRGTVFVSIVDPGVGSQRRSVVMKSKSGHFFVTPDNGTLTLVAESLGVEEIRLIDEAVNRLQNSEESYTFHGRDVYAYTGARLAARKISFEEVGPVSVHNAEMITYQRPVINSEAISGTIDILDIQYGNVWTNISQKMITDFGIQYGDFVSVEIFNGDSSQYKENILFGKTFADVKTGETITYINSLLNFSIAINQDSFASVRHIESGPQWKIVIKK
jgi:S-adenosylmethionine hydrolase